MGETLISGLRLSQNVSWLRPLGRAADAGAGRDDSAFIAEYGALPVPPMLAAYSCATPNPSCRSCCSSALAHAPPRVALLVMTGLIDFYVMPQALWSEHIDWGAPAGADVTWAGRALERPFHQAGLAQVT